MADTDIGRELCEKIRAVFNSRIAGDTTIAAIRKKVENGRATMNDMSVYSRQLGMRLRQAIESTVRPEDLPDETMYQNIAHSILDPLLRENYDEINRICVETQRELDRKARIGLTPQTAEYPAERVMTASFGAAAKELASDAVKVLGRTSENITASASDEYMKTNAEYRSKAGLDAYIVRTDGAGCCKWCAALAGKFKYPDDIPDDVFRRHDNCTCDVSYICDKGRQNVHAKKWTQEPRKVEYSKPTKLTREEAQAKEVEILGRRELTYNVKSGIITEKKITSADNLSDESDIGRVFNEITGRKYKNTVEDFSDGLKALKNEKVKSVLEKAAKDVEYAKSDKKNSYYNKKDNKIFLAESAPPSTVAHELFHKIDSDNSISLGGMLDKCVADDYEKLIKTAEKAGQSLEDMLYLKYPKAFEEKGRLKVEYRGISDIIHGMSKGKVNLGYGHYKKGYWDKPFRLQKETFAQYGRIYYDNNEDVIKMFQSVFPDISTSVSSILSKL